MIDVAMLDCQIAILENALTTHLVTGELPGRLGTRHPNIAPFQAFEAGDGKPVVVCAGHDVPFALLCDAVGRPELATDARFTSADARRRHVDALAGELAAAMRGHTAAEWLERFERAGIACAPVNSVAEVARSPQVAARHMVWHVADPAIGDLAVAGNPIKMADVPDPPARRPPPDLDADRAAILAWLDAQSPSTLQIPDPRAAMKRKTKQ
jgi:CoA:oxalate CoA-transferase